MSATEEIQPLRHAWLRMVVGRVACAQLPKIVCALRRYLCTLLLVRDAVIWKWAPDDLPLRTPRHLGLLHISNDIGRPRHGRHSWLCRSRWYFPSAVLTEQKLA
jgi:hypothetical protein